MGSSVFFRGSGWRARQRGSDPSRPTWRSGEWTVKPADRARCAKQDADWPAHCTNMRPYENKRLLRLCRDHLGRNLPHKEPARFGRMQDSQRHAVAHGSCMHHCNATEQPDVRCRWEGEWRREPAGIGRQHDGRRADWRGEQANP